jgi:hypothetical protein
VWEQIKAKAGVDVVVFISHASYSDDVTYDLVGAASEVLGVPAEQVLIAFGEHWVLHTAQKDYGGLMTAAGKTLPEFLKSLPDFHSRVALIFPKLQPPRFECSGFTDRSMKLHYFSHRPGLAPFVVGLMQGLGKMFGTPVTVGLAEAKADGADHDVFDVTWTSAPAV